MGGGGSYRPSDDEYTKIGDVVKKSLEDASTEPDRNTFISFSHEDEEQVNLLRAQAKNKESDLQFKDFSVKVPFDSDRAEYIRRQIRERIRKCSVVVVFLSETSGASKWVDWEVSEAKRQDKGLVGVYQGESPPSKLPSNFAGSGAKVVPWSHEDLMRAIQDAAGEQD